MSKPISFGFGKSKTSTSTTSGPSAPRPISLPLKRTAGGAIRKSTNGALRGDSEDEDEAPPQPEAVTGFTSSGAILSRPKQEEKERVIVNPGNGDWRKRGRTNLLPADVQAAQNHTQQNGGDLVMVERSEVSTASGLQYAEPAASTQDTHVNGDTETKSREPEKELTEDERALRALLEDGTGKPKSTAVIETQGNVQLNRKDETEDFRADVATRPDSSTLEDYAAMPVEEFGMAMLRGMGQKRRANGEVIKLDRDPEKEKADQKKQRKQEGFLGIGAKAAPGLDGVELGAWGKADMRKNNKGQGFFTPVMMEDKRTGERITEEEFERRKKATKSGNKTEEEDWRERRDRNLQKTNGDANESRKKDTDDRNHESRSSRRDKDRYEDSSRSSSRRETDDMDYSSSHSRRDRDRERSRSRDRRRRDDSHDNRRDSDRYRDRDRYRDEDRYDSSSSRRSGHRDRDRDRDRADRSQRDRR